MSEAFLRWARTSRLPLSAVAPGAPCEDLDLLARMIGDATVVAFSEASHGAAEPMEFRNRLFQYLVEHAGFTAIAIESGLIESRIVHDYVRGGTGDIENVMARGITWGMEEYPQNRALIEWLHAYNSTRSLPQKINFYGFDMSGVISTVRPYESCEVMLGEVFEFLRRFDADAARIFDERFSPFLAIRHHPRSAVNGKSYCDLNQSERDTLTAAINDLIVWLERHESRYVGANAAEDYAWAHRAALNARHMDNCLRQLPPDWLPWAELPLEMPEHYCASSDIRDRTLADNVEWIAQREGPVGKILIFASNWHVGAAPFRVKWQPGEYGAQVPACFYLRRRLGLRLVTIGNLINGGTVWAGHAMHELARPPAHSLDALASQMGEWLFMLDLRRAPPEVRAWLNEQHELVSGIQAIEVPVGRAFDLLFYVDTVTPACRGATAPSQS